MIHEAAADTAQIPSWDAIETCPDEPPQPGMVVYVSGPMSGYVGHNYEAFHRAKQELLRRGFLVESPADHGYVAGWTWLQYIIRDLEVLKGVHGIVVLPYFYASPGACIELIACRRMEMPVWKLDGPQFIGQLRDDGALNYEADDVDVVPAHGDV